MATLSSIPTGDTTHLEEQDRAQRHQRALPPCRTEDVRERLEKARRLRLDQGLYEAEVSCGGEADLHNSLLDCEKNPGHRHYIPAGEFKLSDLPEPHRKQNLFDFLKSELDLVVRVVVTHISTARRATNPDTGTTYPFGNSTGAECMRTGSGWLRWVDRKYTKADGVPCPCPDCKASGNPVYEWAELSVMTAAHVVFDDEEAKMCKVDFFFDSEEDRKNGKVRTVYGIGAKSSSIEEERCHIVCATHDMEFWDQIKEMQAERDRCQEKVLADFEPIKDQVRLMLVLSHPHGCNKQVSIGEWIERREINWSGWTSYTYTAATCPGSSGGAVMLIGKKGAWGLYTSHPHSCRCPEEGVNQSGLGWDEG